MNDTQDLDIVEISKIVVKDVMVKYLFDVADEATFNHMEHDIAKGLIAYDIVFMNIDYDVDVEAINGDVCVTVEIFGIGDHGSVKYTAKYIDCPVMSSIEEVEELLPSTLDTNTIEEILEDMNKNITECAFDDAMKIID